MPQYCLECGTKLAARQIGDATRLACPQCSYVYWGGYSIGVGGLMLRDKRILLVRRAQNPGRGLWTNPGGYAEQNERLEETVVREIQEESQVVGKVTDILAMRDQPRSDVHNLYVVFGMEYVSGQPVPDGEEVDEAGFFGMEELSGMNVAALTRWLAAIAWETESKRDLAKTSKTGLGQDRVQEEPLSRYGLYRAFP